MEFLSYLITFWTIPFFILFWLIVVFGPLWLLAYMEDQAKYHRHNSSHWINRYDAHVTIYTIIHYVTLVLIGIPYLAYSLR